MLENQSLFRSGLAIVLGLSGRGAGISIMSLKLIPLTLSLFRVSFYEMSLPCEERGLS
jgi:hypothetical protein